MQQKLWNVAAASLPLLVMSACVAPREPAPPPAPAPARAPTPAPAPAPAPPLAWEDRAYTPGDWSYVRSSGTSVARYGLPGAPRVTLTCDPRAAQLTLDMPGAPAGPVTVRTSYGSGVRVGLPSASGVQMVLPARDAMFDQIAFSRGRFMLAAGGQELILPTWPELARVVEDCR